jgi:hypothetical protein
MKSTSAKELVMTTQSNACGCQSCDGPGCACGCRQIDGRRDAAGRNAVVIAAVIALAALAASPAAAQTAGCGTAILTDVEVVVARVPQSTITSVHTRPKDGRKPGERSVDAYTTPSERETKSYLVTVRMNDRVYVGRSSGDWFWEFDPTRLVINDPIDACVSRDTLRLRRPDGKDYKTKIVRVVRDVAHEAASETR